VIRQRGCRIWLGGTLAALILTALPGCGTTSPSAATSPDQHPSSVVAPCNRLADEDLTISGLVGISVPAHVTRDCGVLTSLGLPR
jgi:hypothetical protein